MRDFSLPEPKASYQIMIGCIYFIPPRPRVLLLKQDTGPSSTRSNLQMPVTESPIKIPEPRARQDFLICYPSPQTDKVCRASLKSPSHAVVKTPLVRLNAKTCRTKIKKIRKISFRVEHLLGSESLNHARMLYLNHPRSRRKRNNWFISNTA